MHRQPELPAGQPARDIPVPEALPTVIGVRGARHDHLGDADADVPLWRTAAVAGCPNRARRHWPSEH